MGQQPAAATRGSGSLEDIVVCGGLRNKSFVPTGRNLFKVLHDRLTNQAGAR